MRKRLQRARAAFLMDNLNSSITRLLYTIGYGVAWRSACTSSARDRRQPITDSRVLDDISFRLEPDKVLGVLGRTGNGDHEYTNRAGSNDRLSQRSRHGALARRMNAGFPHAWMV
jgi:hypothetical protein